MGKVGKVRKDNPRATERQERVPRETVKARARESSMGTATTVESGGTGLRIVRNLGSYQPTSHQVEPMVIDHAGTNVDYRHPWRTVGELKPSSRSVQIPDQTTFTHSKCEALVGDVEDHGIGELEGAKRFDDKFPVPVPTRSFPKKHRMPELPQRRSQIYIKNFIKTVLRCGQDVK